MRDYLWPLMRNVTMKTDYCCTRNEKQVMNTVPTAAGFLHFVQTRLLHRLKLMINQLL